MRQKFNQTKEVNVEGEIKQLDFVKRFKTGYLRPCSQIVVGQKLEELKVTIRDVSLEPRLGNQTYIYRSTHINST